MKKWTPYRSGLLLVVLAMTLGGCDGGWREPETPRLETRTFALHHMRANEAADLIRPYVYTERVGAPGALGEAQSDSPAITVRETADNLDRIAAVLAEFDRPDDSTDRTLSLRFQLISGNGSELDPRIVGVVTELQRFLRFDGYSLMGEAFVAVAAGRFEQRIRTEAAIYHIDGWYRPSTQTLGIALWRVNVNGNKDVMPLETTVTIQPGKTLVLGTVAGDDDTVILVVHSLVTDQMDGDRPVPE